MTAPPTPAGMPEPVGRIFCYSKHHTPKIKWSRRAGDVGDPLFTAAQMAAMYEAGRTARAGAPTDAEIDAVTDAQWVNSQEIERAAFEAAISAPPYERDTARWPDNMRNAWPGGYKDINVARAWCMWQEAVRQEREACAKLCDEDDIPYLAAAIRSRGAK